MPKRRDFGRDLAVFYLRRTDQHYPKVSSHRVSLRKHLHHDIRRRTGRHIEVLWLNSKQKIAHASACEVRLIPSGAYRNHDLSRCVELRVVDTLRHHVNLYDREMPESGGTGLILGIESSCDE